MTSRRPLFGSLLAMAALIFGAVIVGFTPASAAGHGSSVRDTIIPPTITDFNGDGYADLAVAGLNDPAGAVAAAGGVNVIYGSASGLQATAPDDQYWTANSPGMPQSAQAGAQFGFALGVGDFNADGYSDLAMGAPRQDVGPGLTDAGALYVLYGSAAGLQTSAPAAQYFTADSPGMPSPSVANALFGRSLSAGDYNGDGKDDLAIGAPREDVVVGPTTFMEAGVAYALYGTSAGLQTANPAAQFWTQDSPGVPDEVESSDWFARSLASGDFNGDGYVDLVVGVPLEDEEGGTKQRKDSGAVNVLYGSAAGLQAISPAAQFWDQDSPHVKDNDEAGDYFGHNLAAGDFNGDGYADLALGVRLEDLDERPIVKEAGAVNVLYGSAGGLQTDNPENQFWSQDAHHVLDTAENGEEFGFSVAAGDFNGDGYADLAIGVAFESINDQVQGAGGVNVLYGSSAGLQTDLPENQFWTQDSPRVADGAEVLDNFGFSLVANDYNFDGRIDLAIGVVKEDLEEATTITDAGAVNVLYGGPSGLQTDAPMNQFWSQDSPGMPGDAADLNEFGWWLA